MGIPPASASRPRPRIVAGLLVIGCTLAGLALADVRERMAAGENALRQGQPDAAAEAFRGALAESPDSWEAYDGLGRALKAAGDLEGAEVALRRAVELAPVGARPARDLSDLVLGLGDTDRRREGLAWLGEHAPEDGDVQILVASEARRGGDLVTAAAAVERVRRLRPESKKGMVEEILLHRDALEYDRAETLALAYIERFPFYYQPHVQLARIYRLQGRNEEAEAHYRRALELQPGEPTALTRLGELRLDAGDLEEAIALLDEAVLVRPDNHAAWYLLGRAYLAAGDREKATAAMQRFRELKDALRATARLAGGAAMVDE
ncbi:MAG: tetratricopeptide repeat protein [Acidobacteriota bacterium]|jgi:Flp pilus assembly protein TadD